MIHNEFLYQFLDIGIRSGQRFALLGLEDDVLDLFHLGGRTGQSHLRKVGVDIVLSTRLLSASEVLAFVRRGGVVSGSLLEGAKAEAVEVIVQDGAPVAGKRLMDVRLPRECLVCAYVRGEDAFIPNGQSALMAGDRVILFIQTTHSKEVMKYFKGRD